MLSMLFFEDYKKKKKQFAAEESEEKINHPFQPEVIQMQF